VCPIVLIDGEGDDGWQAAVARARRSIRAGADCHDLEVHRTRSGAVVVLTTRAGHQAIRTISSPDELEATVGALLVTLPDAVIIAAPSGAASSSASGTPSPSPAPSSSSPAPSSSSPASSSSPSTPVGAPREVPPPIVATLALYGGAAVRTTVQSHLVGAVGVAGALIDWNAWRVGLQATWESYEFGDDDGHDLEGSGVSIGLTIGRRFQLTDALAATLDGRIALGAFSENRELDVDTSEIDRTRVEARFGLDAGLEFQLTGALHVRPWVAFEWMPARLGSSTQPDPTLPPSPTMAVVAGAAFVFVAR
jgi:hypothetical protein